MSRTTAPHPPLACVRAAAAAELGRAGGERSQMRTAKLIVEVFILSVCACAAGNAQGLFGDNSPDDPTYIVCQLLGTNSAFSATIHLAYIAGTNSFNADMSYAILNRNIRSEFSISKIPDLKFSPKALAKAQRCGLDHTIAVESSDKSFFLYPDIRAWVDMTKSNQSLRAQRKIRKREIYQETLNGHPCIKYGVLMSGDGRYRSALLWEATDLHGFPLRMDWTGDDGANWSVEFSDVDTKPPHPQLFEIPSGYRRYSDLEELVKALCKESSAEEEPK